MASSLKKSTDQYTKMKGSLSVLCSGGSVEHPKYVKINNGEEISLKDHTAPRDNGQELVLADVKLNNDDKYACTSGDTRIEFSVQAEVSGIDCIKDLQRSLTVTENQDLTLDCEFRAKGGNAVLTKNGQQFRDKRISFEPNEYKFVIKDIKAEDVGEYRCVYNGFKTTFTITGIFPKEKKQSSKMSLTFICNVKTVTLPKWMKGEEELKSGDRIELRPDMQASELRIKSVTKRDEGSYSCCYGDANTRCNIKVEDRPQFTTRLQKNIQTKEKESLFLNCELSKSTNAVTWFKNKKEVKNTSRITVLANGNQHSLAINDMSKADAGEYRCECKDDRDIASCWSVIVEERPKFTRHLPNDIKANEKESLTLNCELNKSTNAVTWFQNEKKVKDSSKITVSANGNQHSLTIKDMKKDDAGQYRCECKDDRDISSSCSVIVEDTQSIWMKYTSPIFVIVCSVLLNVIITYTGILDGTASSKSHEAKELDRLNAFSRRLDAIDTAVSDMEQQHDNSKNALTEILEKHKEDVLKKDNANFTILSSKIEDVERNISKKADVDDIKGAEKRNLKGLTAIESDFDTKVKKIRDELRAKFQELSNSTDVFNRTLSKYNTTFEQFQNETNKKIQEIIRLLEDLNLTVENDLKSKLEEVEDEVKKVELAKEKAEKLVEELQGDVDRIKPNTFNREALTMAFMVLIIFVFMLALWIYKVQNSVTAGGPGQHRDMNSKDVLQRIPHRVSLSNSICIVSFDEARQEAHEALIKSAFLTAGNIQTKYFVVRRHEHLINLPRCKLFMMCTEFSERHVIIEEPGLGLGDLKRCTYQTIQRYGAEMIILYTRDPGSRNLGDQLYNRKIHCVSAQPELSGLRDLGRFFSTYDELSATQKKALKETVVKCLQ